jgi:hypothetical protein
MIRYLTENDIQQLLTMPITLQCAEQVFDAPNHASRFTIHELPSTDLVGVYPRLII